MILVNPSGRSRLTPLFHLWWRFSRGMTLGVRGCVVDAEGRILLIRHSYVPGWHFPGGGVEVGQTVEEALGRELEEEAAVELTGPARLIGLYHNAGTSKRDHVAFFLVEAWRQPHAPVPNAEIVEHGFFARDALPEGTTRATLARLAELYGGVDRAMTW